MWTAAIALALMAGCSSHDVPVDVNPPPARDAGTDVSLIRDSSTDDGSIWAEAEAEAEAESDDAFDPFGNFDRTTPNRPDSRADHSVGSGDDASDAGVVAVQDVAAGDVQQEVGAPDAAPETGNGCTTIQCALAAISPECLACANDPNMGSCGDPVANGGLTALCEGVADLTPGRSEAQVCLDVISGIAQTGCAADGQLDFCLCGDADPVACQNGTAEPKGPLAAKYEQDLGPAIKDVTKNFTSRMYGAGAANELMQCLIAFACPCASPAVSDGGPE